MPALIRPRASVEKVSVCRLTQLRQLRWSRAEAAASACATSTTPPSQRRAVTSTAPEAQARLEARAIRRRSRERWSSQAAGQHRVARAAGELSSLGTQSAGAARGAPCSPGFAEHRASRAAGAPSGGAPIGSGDGTANATPRPPRRRPSPCGVLRGARQSRDPHRQQRLHAAVSRLSNLLVL